MLKIEKQYMHSLCLIHLSRQTPLTPTEEPRMHTMHTSLQAAD